MRPALSLALLLLGPTPNASDSAFALELSASEACPSEAELRARVEASIGPRSSPSGVRAQVSLRPQVGGYELVLQLSRDGWREHHQLRAPSCDELAWLATQLIAMTIDPFVFTFDHVASEPSEAIVVRRSPPVQRPRSRVRPIVQRPRRVASEPQRPAELADDGAIVLTPRPRLAIDVPRSGPRRRPTYVGFAIDGITAVNLLPSVGGGAGATVRVDVRFVRAMVGASGLLGGEFRGRQNPEAGGNLWAWSFEAGVCGLPGWRRLQFPLCMQTGLGQFVATGVGVTEPRPETEPWWWLSGGAGVEWFVRPRLGLRLGANLLGSLVRPGFHIDDSDVRYRVPPIGARFHVGVTGRFGASVRPHPRAGR